MRRRHRWPSSATAIGTASRTTSSSSRSASTPRCRCASAHGPCKLHRRLGRALRAINPDVVGVDLRSRHHRQLPHSARHRRRALPENRLLRADQLGVVRQHLLSAANAADFSDANNIVYGHQANDGSMFRPSPISATRTRSTATASCTCSRPRRTTSSPPSPSCIARQTTLWLKRRSPAEAGAPGLRAGQGRPFRRHGGGGLSLCRRHEAHVRVLHLRQPGQQRPVGAVRVRIRFNSSGQQRRCR